MKLTPARWHAGQAPNLTYTDAAAGRATIRAYRIVGKKHPLVLTFRHDDRKGRNRVPGHLKALRAGHYLLSIVVTSHGKTSRAYVLHFTVLPAAPR